MALISCPKCDKQISDKARMCPHCGYKKYAIKNSVIGFLILLLVMIVVVFGFVILQKQQRERKIQSILSQVEQYHLVYDFEGIEGCCDELDKLGYVTTDIRKELEYEKQVYRVVKEFYETIKSVDDQLHNNSYSELSSLVREMNPVIKAFNDLEINEESEIGRYISEMKNNSMYQGLRSTLISNVGVDYDYGLTTDAYDIIFETYTEEILKVDLPDGMEDEKNGDD